MNQTMMIMMMTRANEQVSDESEHNSEVMMTRVDL